MRISDWSSDVCSSDLGWGTRGNIPCPNGAIALRGVAPFLLNPTAERKHGPSTYLEAGKPRERHWLAFGAQGLHVAADGRAGYRHRVSLNRSRRSEERLVGKGGGRQCRFRGAASH